MKKSELRQIIREEIQVIMERDVAYDLTKIIRSRPDASTKKKLAKI